MDKTATDIFQPTKQALGDNAVSLTRVLEWYLNGSNDLKTGVRIFKMIQ
jgi:hypothetical protein